MSWSVEALRRLDAARARRAELNKLDAKYILDRTAYFDRIDSLYADLADPTVTGLRKLASEMELKEEVGELHPSGSYWIHRPSSFYLMYTKNETRPADISKYFTHDRWGSMN